MKSAVSFALAWLAAWCQVVLVATMSWGALAISGSAGGVPICHADAEQGQPQPTKPVHDGHGCVLCAICQLHGVFVVLPATAATPANRNAIKLAHFVTAQPRAPPLFKPLAAQPRGPPPLTRA